MNHEKAKEYFSAYYEGTLEAGLRQSFEQRLKADADLRQEFEAFAVQMDELAEFFKTEEIEIPVSLSDRIATRIEAAEAARPKFRLQLPWVRNLAFAGLAGLALVGAGLGLRSGGRDPQVAMGGVGAVGSSETPTAPVVPFEIAVERGRTVLTTERTGEHVFRIEVGGKSERIRTLDGLPKGELTNPNAQAVAFRVTLDGGEGATLVAVPGSQRRGDAEGKGDLEALALALADRYGVTVATTARVEGELRWNFEGRTAQDAASEALAGESMTVDLSRAGVLTIQHQ